jgi:hypothetical protein
MAKLTLSFSEWKEGRVVPATVEMRVEGEPKKEQKRTKD